MTGWRLTGWRLTGWRLTGRRPPAAAHRATASGPPRGDYIKLF